jgi:hypothetical protein
MLSDINFPGLAMAAGHQSPNGIGVSNMLPDYKLCGAGAHALAVLLSAVSLAAPVHLHIRLRPIAFVVHSLAAGTSVRRRCRMVVVAGCWLALFRALVRPLRAEVRMRFTFDSVDDHAGTGSWLRPLLVLVNEPDPKGSE